MHLVDMSINAGEPFTTFLSFSLIVIIFFLILFPLFIAGFGSIGTFIEGPIIGIISTSYGWSGMFYFMIFVTFAGTAAVYRASVIKSRQIHVLPTEVPLKEALLESS